MAHKRNCPSYEESDVPCYCGEPAVDSSVCEDCGRPAAPWGICSECEKKHLETCCKPSTRPSTRPSGENS